MKLETKRKRFFNENVGADKVLDVYNCEDFAEYTVKRGGDVECYRVYGTDKTNFCITEK